MSIAPRQSATMIVSDCALRNRCTQVWMPSSASPANTAAAIAAHRV